MSRPAPPLNPTNALVGCYFHSREETDPATFVKWQGVVLGEVGPGAFLVEVLSWLDGLPTARKIVYLLEMKPWLFYADAEEMGQAYQHLTHKLASEGLGAPVVYSGAKKR